MTDSIDKKKKKQQSCDRRSRVCYLNLRKKMMFCLNLIFCSMKELNG